MTRRQGNADLWSAQPRGSAAGETNLKQRYGSRLGVSPGGTATRRQGNADLWSAQPRGSAAGETNLKQRHGSRLGVSPRGTATRRQGNADLWSAQPRGSAAGETNLKRRHGPYSNGYFNRRGGAGAGHPASRQYVVRPPPAGGADRRSAFPEPSPRFNADRRCAVRSNEIGGAQRCWCGFRAPARCRSETGAPCLRDSRVVAYCRARKNNGSELCSLPA